MSGSAQTACRRRIEEAAIRLFSERGNQQITVRELATAAGVARGTIYNHIESTEALFAGIAARLADEMHQRVKASLGYTDDPAVGLSHEVRFFVRRAHTEPAWGWFIYRFSQSDDTLRELLHGVPSRALAKGRRTGRYRFRDGLQPSVMSVFLGSTLSAMWMVLEGHQTWREAGSSTAELLLRAVGVPDDEAHRLSLLDLPELVALDMVTDP